MTLLRHPTRAAPEAPAAEALVRYEDDAYTWSLQQAALLRAGRTDSLDFENLADEIADVAGREYDKLESALTRVIQHLLEWEYQPERRSRGWALSIEEHRERVHHQLQDHPGLRGALERALERASVRGRRAALAETNLPSRALPEAPRLEWDDIMNRTIVWPED